MVNYACLEEMAKNLFINSLIYVSDRLLFSHQIRCKAIAVPDAMTNSAQERGREPKALPNVVVGSCTYCILACNTRCSE
jgi:hypothetical protein